MTTPSRRIKLIFWSRRSERATNDGSKNLVVARRARMPELCLPTRLTAKRRGTIWSTGHRHASGECLEDEWEHAVHGQRSVKGRGRHGQGRRIWFILGIIFALVAFPGLSEADCKPSETDNRRLGHLRSSFVGQVFWFGRCDRSHVARDTSPSQGGPWRAAASSGSCRSKGEFLAPILPGSQLELPMIPECQNQDLGLPRGTSTGSLRGGARLL